VPSPARLVVIDRDGVINEDSDDFIKSVAEWRPIRGSLEAIATLTQRGFTVAVITNQSGVGRGLLDEATLAEIHATMRARVRAAGGELAGVYHCPHRPDAGCDCRKPGPGMFRALERDLGVSVLGVPYIGDRTSDVLAARGVGARPILVRTGVGAATERSLGDPSIAVFDDLWSAAQGLLAEEK